MHARQFWQRAYAYHEMLPEQCDARPVDNMVILARLTGALQLRFVFRLHRKYPLHRSTRDCSVHNEIKATFMTFTWLGQCIDTARKWSMKMSLAFFLSSSSFVLISALLSSCLSQVCPRRYHILTRLYIGIGGCQLRIIEVGLVKQLGGSRNSPLNIIGWCKLYNFTNILCGTKRTSGNWF